MTLEEKNLEYSKSKCFSYEIAANYKIFVKDHQYDTYKVLKNYSFTDKL